MMHGMKMPFESRVSTKTARLQEGMEKKKFGSVTAGEGNIKKINCGHLSFRYAAFGSKMCPLYSR